MLRKTVFVFGLMLTAPTALLAQQGALEPTLRAMPVAEQAGLNVKMGDITDSRTTGKFFAELKIDLKTEGDALAQAFGVAKPVITAAVDDTGRSLLKDDKKNEPLFWTFEVLDKKRATSLESQIGLLNPLRKATSVSFMGYVDVLTPEHDPLSLYVVKNFIAQAGKPLLPKSYQKTGLEITLMTKPLMDKMKQERERVKAQAEAQKAAGNSAANAGQAMGEAFGKIFESMFSGFFSMGENDLLFIVKDPQRQMATLQVVDAAGTPLKTSGGRSMSQDEVNGTVNYTLSFAAALPANAQLKVYFATPKSVQRVPFKYESVRLP